MRMEGMWMGVKSECGWRRRHELYREGDRKWIEEKLNVDGRTKEGMWKECGELWGDLYMNGHL